MRHSDPIGKALWLIPDPNDAIRIANYVAGGSSRKDMWTRYSICLKRDQIDNWRSTQRPTSFERSMAKISKEINFEKAKEALRIQKLQAAAEILDLISKRPKTARKLVVIGLELSGHPAREIMEILEISRANLDQLACRGKKLLQKMSISPNLQKFINS